MDKTVDLERVSRTGEVGTMVTGSSSGTAKGGSKDVVEGSTKRI